MNDLSIQEMAERLAPAGKKPMAMDKGKSFKTWCPAHDDQRSPSLGISRRDNGKLVWHCYAGCTQEMVLQALIQADLVKGKSNVVPFPTTEEKLLLEGYKYDRHHVYRNAKGGEIYHLVMYRDDDNQGRPKTARWRHRTDKGKWKYSMPKDGRVLYRLPELLASDKTVPVHTTEGEKDADTLAKLGFIATNLKLVADVDIEPLRGRDIIIHRDNDPVNKKTGNKAGVQHVDRFAHAVKDIVASLKIVPDYPIREGDKKADVTSWLEAGGTKEDLDQRIAQAVAYEPATPPVIDRIAELNGQHFLIENVNNRTVIGTWVESDGLPRISYQARKDFELCYLNETIETDVAGETKRVPLGRAWLTSPRQHRYAGVVFQPGGPDHVVIKKKSHLNLWRGFAVDDKKGTWRLMKRHILRVLADRDKKRFKYIMRWIAWAIQNPGRKTGTVLVLMGEEGTGKGVFGSALVLLFGTAGQVISSGQRLTGKFNAHLKTCCMVFVDEAVAPDDRRAIGQLKVLITGNMIDVEGKHVDAEQARSYLKMVFATNEAMAVKLGLKDRRHAVFAIPELRHVVKSWVPEELRGQLFSPARKKAYFDALFAEGYDEERKNTAGLSAMLHDLSRMKLGDWHPRDDIPDTDAREEQKFLSSSPTKHKLAEYLDGYEGHVRSSTLWQLPLLKRDWTSRDYTAVAAAMKELGWEMIKRVKTPKGEDGKRRNDPIYAKGESTIEWTAEDLIDGLAVRRRQRTSEGEQQKSDRVNGVNADEASSMFHN